MQQFHAEFSSLLRADDERAAQRVANEAQIQQNNAVAALSERGRAKSCDEYVDYDARRRLDNALDRWIQRQCFRDVESARRRGSWVSEDSGTSPLGRRTPRTPARYRDEI